MRIRAASAGSRPRPSVTREWATRPERPGAGARLNGRPREATETTRLPLISPRLPACLHRVCRDALGAVETAWPRASAQLLVRLLAEHAHRDRGTPLPHSRHSPPLRGAAPSGLERPARTRRRPTGDVRRGPVRSRGRLNGAAPESNRPSRGLHDRTGFEDLLGHRAHAAPPGSVATTRRPAWRSTTVAIRRIAACRTLT